MTVIHHSTSDHTCEAHDGYCRIHGAQWYAQYQAYAAEVQTLRQHIAVLEQQLATAQEATSPRSLESHGRPADRRRSPSVVESRKTDFGTAWADEGSSQAEREAAAAFFADGTTDRRARKWLLGS